MAISVFPPGAPGVGGGEGPEPIHLALERAMELEGVEQGRASVHSVKVRIGISCRRTLPGRVIVAPRRGKWARAGPSRRARVGRLACRTSLSTAGFGPS